jgi:CheY-like chemotaxis protein
MDDIPTLAASSNILYYHYYCMAGRTPRRGLESIWHSYQQVFANTLGIVPGTNALFLWTENAMITVLLVDDHDALRKSLRHLLGVEGDINVLATAPNGVEAVDKARQHCFDVIVMDISMPLLDGIEAARQIHQACQDTRVLMLSSYDSAVYVRRALAAGAAGYVLKDAAHAELLLAVRTIALGKRYFSQKIAKIAEEYLGWKSRDMQAD